MKKCPSCEKTFDDAMRFCQICGTPLVEDVPFDPYATIVGTAATVAPPVESAGDDAAPSQSAISMPDDVLEAPNADPLKTMYVSDSEMKQVLGASGDAPVEEIKADEVGVETPVLEVPPIPEPPPPRFNEMSPPPSPFSESASADAPAVPAPPAFLEPEPATQERGTVTPPEVATAAVPPPAPVQEWTPPPSPDASWQNQEIGANTPFQEPPVGVAAGQNKTLAIVSLVTGIISLLCCSGIFLVGVAAIVTGFMANSKVSGNPTEYGGKGLAWAGIILGALSILLGVLYWVLVAAGFVRIPNF